MSGETLEVLGARLAEIEIGAKGLQAVMQNVRTIMTTLRGSVFLDRQFGIDANIIDMPLNELHARLAMNLTEQIENYEPRVKVSSVTFTESDVRNGQVVPLVQVKINNGVLL